MVSTTSLGLTLPILVFVQEWMKNAAHSVPQVEMTWPEAAAYHWMFGLHSGIPSCCVAEYTGGDEQIARNRAKWRMLGTKRSWFNYIPCDYCIWLVQDGILTREDIPKLHKCDHRLPDCRVAILGSAAWVEL